MVIDIYDDFNLYKIATCGQCFRVERFYDETFRFITGPNILYIRKVNSHKYEVSCSQVEWATIWYPYFDLNRLYTDVRNSIPADDAFMVDAAAEGKGIRILRQDPWEMLITFIISQRKSIPSIKTVVNNLCERYGQKIDVSNDTVYLFPSAESLYNITDKELQGCGLGYRVPYIKDAAERIYTNEIDLKRLYLLDDDLLRCNLKSIKGVGDKVANCIMLFAYNRIASVPLDVWIKKLIEEEYGGTSPFSRYEANAGIMQQYAFYHMINHRKAVK